MRTDADITIRGSIRVALRSWRGRLRGRHGAVALLALLTIGLLEPLACILHCEVWEDLLRASSLAAHRHGAHHHVMPGGATMRAGATAGDQAALASAAPDDVPCLVQSQSHLPHGIFPQPFHEMALTFAIVVAALGFVERLLLVPPRPPPLVAHVPPLRPPIPSLGLG